MKNWFTIFAVVLQLFCSVCIIAQEMQPRSPKERAERQTNWMQKNLALTEEQNKKAYEINLKHALQIDGAMNDAPGRDRREEIRGINIRKDAALKLVLNVDQYQKYLAHEQEMREQSNEMNPGMHHLGTRR